MDVAYLLHDAFPGSELLTHNLFRLAQESVLCAPRDLEQRLKMLELARQLEGVPIPPGRVALAPFDADDDLYAELKQAVEQNKDPLYRFVQEFFWFWPPDYTGESDSGYVHLLANRCDEAEASWIASDGLAARHNLAVLSSLAALDVSAQPELWDSAYEYWQQTLDHDFLAEVLTARASKMEDARFTKATLQSLIEQLPFLAAAIGAGHLVELARLNKEEGLSRLRTALQSHFPPGTIQRVLERATKSHGDRLRMSIKKMEEAVAEDNLATPDLIRPCLSQCQRELEILDRVFGEGNPYVTSLADAAARAVQVAQVAHGDKTEDWQASIDMIKAARAIARGDYRCERLEENLVIAKGNLEMDNNWVCPGYWDLPEALRTRFERARANAEADMIEAALLQLREILADEADGDVKEFIRSCVRHCMAYALRRYAISIWNKAFDARDEAYESAVDDAIYEQIGSPLSNFGIFSTMDAIQAYEQAPTGVMCHRCETEIYGTYWTRTLRGEDYHYCTTCDRAIQARFDVATEEFNEKAVESLELHRLAEALNPDNAHVKAEIDNIHANTDAEDIRPRSVFELALEWQLLDLPYVMRELIGDSSLAGDTLFNPGSASGTDIHTLFQYFMEALLALSNEERSRQAQDFFELLVQQKAPRCATVAGMVVSDEALANEFTEYCLRSNHAQARAFWYAAVDTVDNRLTQIELFGQAINSLSEDDPWCAKLAQDCYEGLRKYAQFDRGNTLHSDALAAFMLRVEGYLDEEAVLSLVYLGQLNDPHRALTGIEYLVSNYGTGIVVKMLTGPLLEDVSAEHTLNMLRACMFHNIEELQNKAIDKAARLNNLQAFCQLLVIGLAAKSKSVRATCRSNLIAVGTHAAEVLLQGLHTNHTQQRRAILEVLEALPDIPQTSQLVSAALTVPDTATSLFVRDLIRQHHPDWPEQENAPSLLSWIKFTATSAATHNQTAAQTLLADYKAAAGLWQRMTSWAVAPEQPPDPYEEQWWARPRKGGRKKPARRGPAPLPAGMEVPENPTMPCPCGSGKRYENCHGFY